MKGNVGTCLPIGTALPFCKMWIFNNTAARTQNLALRIYLNIRESQRRDCLDIHLLVDAMVGRFAVTFPIRETRLGQAGKLGV